MDHFEAGELWIIARAYAIGLATHVGVGEVGRAIHRVINALTAGAVGEEGVAVLVPMVAPGIAAATGEDRQRPRVGIEPPNAARVESAHPVGRLDVRVRVNRLVHVEVPVITPAQRVEIVMGVLGTEARQSDRAAVGLAVAIGVLQMQKLMTGRHVASALSIRHHARRNEQAIGKDGVAVGLAVAVGVFQYHHGIDRRLPRLDLRIDLRRSHPQASLRIPVHVDGLMEERVLSPEADFQSIARIKARDGLLRNTGPRVGGRAGLGCLLRQQSSHFGQDLRVGLFGRTQTGDLGVPLGDHRIELRNLDTIAPLLVLAEAEEVGPVGRAPAVEKQLILVLDGRAEQGGVGALGRSLNPEELGQPFSEHAVAGVIENHRALVGHHAEHRDTPRRPENVHDRDVRRLAQSAQRLSDFDQSLGVGRIGPLALLLDRGEKNKTHGLAAGLPDPDHQSAGVGDELGKVRRMGLTRRNVSQLEGCGHAVAENGDRRFGDGNLLLNALEPACLRLVPIEAGAGLAHGGVAGPGKVAEGDTTVGVRRSQRGL